MKNLVVNGNYFGFNPDSCVQASMACNACGGSFTSNEGLMIFCPNCGDVATSAGIKVEASFEDVYRLCNCSVCGSELYSDLEPEVVAQFIDKMYCTACGSGLKNTGIAEEELELDLEEDDTGDASAGDDGAGDAADDGAGDDDAGDDDNVSLPGAIKDILSNVLEDTSYAKMDLWESPAGEVIRNVTISSVPVARIFLSDQDNPEELSDTFKGDEYENALTQSMLTEPVGQVLASANARILSELQEDIAPQIEQEIEDQVEKQVEEFTGSFKETFLMVIEGVSKNLFGTEVNNSLKEGLWEALAAVGVENPQDIIEDVFAKNAKPFLSAVMDKTLDLLDKDGNVRGEILQMITSAGNMPVESKSSVNAFSNTLAKGNFPFSPSSSQDATSNLRSRLNLRKA